MKSGQPVRKSAITDGQAGQICLRCGDWKLFVMFPPAKTRGVVCLKVCTECRDKPRPIKAEKLCPSCDVVKPVAEFSPCSRRNDGMSRDCRQCQNAYSSEYRRRNLDKMRAKGRKFAKKYQVEKQAYDREYQKANVERAKSRPSRSLESQRIYASRGRARNKERIREESRRYRAKHLGKILTYNTLRKARQKTCQGSYTEQEWLELCQRFGNRCLCCGRTDLKLTVDHIVPLVKGGRNDISNLQCLCRSCNSAKGARHTTDYRPA